MRTDIFIRERLYCRNTDIGACFFQYQCTMPNNNIFDSCVCVFNRGRRDSRTARLCWRWKRRWVYRRHVSAEVMKSTCRFPCRHFQSYDVTPHACFLCVSGEKDVREACCWVGRGVEGESMWSRKTCSDWLFNAVLDADWLRCYWSVSVHWNVVNAYVNTLSLRAIHPTRVKPV